MKINALKDRLDTEYKNFLKKIDKKRKKEISEYRTQRDFELEQLKQKYNK